jgi:hypothetical protein
MDLHLSEAGFSTKEQDGIGRLCDEELAAKIPTEGELG